MSLPFEDNQFDYATIGFGLRNVPDYMQVLHEMKRVVKPGGMVVCLELSSRLGSRSKAFIISTFNKCLGWGNW